MTDFVKADIIRRISNSFSSTEKVKSIIEKLNVPLEEKDRVIRCVLYLSDSDYDSLERWVKVANCDRRDVYYFAEYDNRSERKWNFSIAFDKQQAYQYRDKK